MRLSVLTALAEGSLPRLSQVVGRLEKRGWVRRTPDPADGRYTLAILTGEGFPRSTAGHNPNGGCRTRRSRSSLRVALLAGRFQQASH